MLQIHSMDAIIANEKLAHAGHALCLAKGEFGTRGWYCLVGRLAGSALSFFSGREMTFFAADEQLSCFEVDPEHKLLFQILRG